jgi:hypothetical protein
VGVLPSFPPSVVVAVKAFACQLPYEHGLPLSRFSVRDIKRELLRRGLVASIGETTLWRWLSEDAIKPWRHRSWIFPRDPAFEARAGPILDLYNGIWQGKNLTHRDFVVSADEKTSIQARQRPHPTLAPKPGRGMRIEHEYKRKGALAYLAAWDVHRAKVFGRCEESTGIKPFTRLVAQVMSQEPYRSAHRVFWIVDNGSSHRGQSSVDRLKGSWQNITLLHTPIHASWLNQIEIYFSVVQRKVITPNDFTDVDQLSDRILSFQPHYESIAKPFQWNFTRQDLKKLLAKLEQEPAPLKFAA